MLWIMAFLLKLPEFDSRSVLQVVKESFQEFGANTYAVRMIYAGEHALTRDLFKTQMHKSVQLVNHGYTDIPLNGILLVYDSYFVHILEGSEDTLHRQLRFMFHVEKDWITETKRRDEEEAAAAELAAMEYAKEEGIPYVPPENPPELPERIIFRKLKMLIVYHSVSTNWQVHYARPPSLVGKLDLYAPIEDHMEQLRVCLDKITMLCKLSNEEGQMLSFEGLSANDPKMEALPEVALLDYLLTSKFILDLRETLSYHRRVDDYVFYFEQVWPLPTAYTPRHLYKLKIDDCFVEPLPIMPWELKDEEEELEEGQSKGSSDSD